MFDYVGLSVEQDLAVEVLRMFPAKTKARYATSRNSVNFETAESHTSHEYVDVVLLSKRKFRRMDE